MNRIEISNRACFLLGIMFILNLVYCIHWIYTSATFPAILHGVQVLCLAAGIICIWLHGYHKMPGECEGVGFGRMEGDKLIDSPHDPENKVVFVFTNRHTTYCSDGKIIRRIYHHNANDIYRISKKVRRILEATMAKFVSPLP